jgi:hypothetical protein
MMLIAEIWQPYRGTTQTEGKITKPKDFARRSSKWGMKSASLCLFKESSR